MATSAGNHRNYLLLVAILALAGFFRFYAITEIPPGLWPDEAANGVDALQALESGRFKVFYPENNGREGMFINLQALAVKVFGNEPWALRVVSAVFGTLTVLGLYLVTKELFQPKSQAPSSKSQTNPNSQNSKYQTERVWKLKIENSSLVALLSSFFLALSFWHVNFSRIGFRAISVPFFAVFGMYWMLKTLRTGKISSALAGGIFTGLGFHTYIAFRFMPLVIAVPIIASLRNWWHKDTTRHPERSEGSLEILQSSRFERYSFRMTHCIPCIIALFLFVTFVVALPIGLYFYQHPEDFASRAAPISIFADPSPLVAFLKSNLLTLGMFNTWGDCNPRHNFFCHPQLYWPVGIFFIIGLAATIRGALNAGFGNWKLETGNSRASVAWWTLLAWFAFMMLPATLTRESLPHALRAIGLIPPVFIFAGLGAVIFRDWFKNKVMTPLEAFANQPQNEHLRPKLRRIQRELWILALVLLLWIATAEGVRYFLRWAPQPAVARAFETSKTDLAYYIRTIPPEIPVYVLVNEPSLLVHGISLNAQPVVFLTHGRPNIFFVDAEKFDNLPPYLERAVIVALHSDKNLLTKLKARYPAGKIKPFTGNIIPFVISR